MQEFIVKKGLQVLDGGAWIKGPLIFPSYTNGFLHVDKQGVVSVKPINTPDDPTFLNLKGKDNRIVLARPNGTVFSLPNGQNGQVLKLVNGSPTWETILGGTGGGGILPNGTNTKQYLGWNGTTWVPRIIQYSEISNAPTGGLTGTGTTNYVARWTPNGTTLGIGTIQDNGANVGIGTTPNTSYKLDVGGLVHLQNIPSAPTSNEILVSDSGVISTRPLSTLFTDAPKSGYTNTFGDNTIGPFVITHNLTSRAVLVQIYETATGDSVNAEINRTSSNTVTISGFTSPVSLDKYTVVVYRIVASDTSYVGQFGNNTVGPFEISHNLNSKAVMVQVYESVSGDEVRTNIRRESLNKIIISEFSQTVTTNKYTVLVHRII